MSSASSGESDDLRAFILVATREAQAHIPTCASKLSSSHRASCGTSRHLAAMSRSSYVQRCLLAFVALSLLSAAQSDAVSLRSLLASGAPPSSSIISSILSKGVTLFSFGEKTQVSPPILNGAVDTGAFSTAAAPSNGYNTKSNAILFQCRAVGNQIYTTSKSGRPLHAAAACN